MNRGMEQSVTVSPLRWDDEVEPEPQTNTPARIASRLGIVGIILLAGVIALATSAVITALTTPDFMPDDLTDDPFATTSVACVLPFIFGCIGLGFGIAAVRAIPTHGHRAVAVRGLVFGILNVVLPVAIGVLFISFDAASAACGGG